MNKKTNMDLTVLYFTLVILFAIAFLYQAYINVSLEATNEELLIDSCFLGSRYDYATDSFIQVEYNEESIKTYERCELVATQLMEEK